MGSMSDLGLPERQMTGRVEPPKGMLAILEQLFCKYWNRLEDCLSASPASQEHILTQQGARAPGLFLTPQTETVMK